MNNYNYIVGLKFTHHRYTHGKHDDYGDLNSGRMLTDELHLAQSTHYFPSDLSIQQATQNYEDLVEDGLFDDKFQSLTIEVSLLLLIIIHYRLYITMRIDKQGSLYPLLQTTEVVVQSTPPT